jgi:hypothetical protein
MPAMRPLCHLMGVNLPKLSKEEHLFLEAELFVRICEELKEIIREQNKDYFRLMKFNTEKENAMIEANFISCIMNDILSTQEYNLPGIAYYTDTPEDVVYEVVAGRNTNPSLSLSRRVIELHVSVRPKLYRSIMSKIISELPPST